MPVIAAQAGFVSLPAATYPAAGRTRASMNAQAVSAIAANRSAVNTQNSNHAMWASLPATDPEIRGIGTTARSAPRRRTHLGDATGPRSAARSSGALVVGRQTQTSVFLSGHRGRVRRLGGTGAGHAGRRPLGGRLARGRGGLLGSGRLLLGRLRLLDLGRLRLLDLGRLRLLDDVLSGRLGRLGGGVDLLLGLGRDLGRLGRGLLRDRGHLVGGLDDGLGRLLEHVVHGVLDGVDSLLGTAHDPAEAGLTAQVLDDLGTVLGQVLDGGQRLGTGGLDQAGDGVAQHLGTDGGGELLRGGAGVAGSLGRPGTGLLDGQVGLDLGLARQGHDSGGGLGAELRDGGAGPLDGEVTGADDGEVQGLVGRHGGLAVLLHGRGGGHADSLDVLDGDGEFSVAGVVLAREAPAWAERCSRTYVSYSSSSTAL